MAKIAVEFDRSAAAPPVACVLAQGDGWTASDVICTSGPSDRPFEEQHSRASIAMVLAGTFQYRSHGGCELMTPGSLLLGSPGQCFECGHEHGTGDRCVSFGYTTEFLERLTADAGGSGAGTAFRTLRVPPLRMLSPLIAQASAALAGYSDTPWEELSIQLAAQAVQLDRGLSPGTAGGEPSAIARVTRVVRMMDSQPDGAHSLTDLARESRLSPYHFLRTFQSVTGVTPHQYLLRVRLRQAAIRLSTESAKILDIALDCGFGDISNFNRTFRSEFGISPRAYRTQTRRGGGFL